MRGLLPAELTRFLLRGGAWALGLKVAATLSSFALISLLSRLLEPGDMGLYFLAANLVNFFALVGRAGLDHVLLRWLSRGAGRGDWRAVRAIYRRGAGLALLGSLVMGVLCVAGGIHLIEQHLFSGKAIGPLAAALGVWIVFTSLRITGSITLQALHRIGEAVFFERLAFVLAALPGLIAVWLIGARLELRQVVWLIVLGAGVSGLAALGVSLWRLPAASSTSEPAQEHLATRDLLAQAWPLLVTSLTSFALVQSDLWILGAMASAEEIAYYGAAARLVMVTSLVLAVANAVVPTVVARLHQRGDLDQMERMTRLVATWTAAPSLAILALFALLGRPILALLFGPAFAAGYPFLVVLSIGRAVAVGVGSCGMTLIMTGYQRTVMAISLAATVIALAAGAIGAASYGSLGVALAYAGVTIGHQFTMLYALRRRVGIWTHVDWRLVQEALAQLRRRRAAT